MSRKWEGSPPFRGGLSLGEWLVHVGRAGATIEIKEPRSWSDDRGSLLTRTRKQTIGLLWLLKT